MLPISAVIEMITANPLSPLSGFDVSKLIMTCKELCAVTTPLANTIAVNEMYAALQEYTQQMHAGSVLLIQLSSFHCVEHCCSAVGGAGSAEMTRVFFRVSKFPSERKIVISRTSDDGRFLVTVRPSVFHDPRVLAERVLAVNHFFSAKITEILGQPDSEIQQGISSIHIVVRRERFTALIYTIKRNVLEGTVKVVRNDFYAFRALVSPRITAATMSSRGFEGLGYTALIVHGVGSTRYALLPNWFVWIGDSEYYNPETPDIVYDLPVDWSPKTHSHYGEFRRHRA